MNSRRRRRHGFTLIELLVVISIIGVLVGLLLPAIQSARATARRAQCLNNMKNVALALNNYALRKGSYPAAGTFLEVGSATDAASSVLADAQGPSISATTVANAARSWVVEILQDLDQQDMANNWTPTNNYLSTVVSDKSTTPNYKIGNTALAILRCPDDINAVPDQGNLSYVANGGFGRFGASPRVWTGFQGDGAAGGSQSGIMTWGTNPAQSIHQKLGVMFLNSYKGDGSNPAWGGMRTTAASIVDGAGSTVLLGESTLVGYSSGETYSGGVQTNWAAPFPNFCLFIGSDNICDGGNCAATFGDYDSYVAGTDGAAWANANKIGTFENLDYGQNLTIKGTFPFVTSGHSGGSNFAFCDGSVRFIQNTIDGTVYAKILTPAGSKLPPPFKQQPVSQDAFVQ